jgi:uncharacterized protein YceH (UPF0502 family)
MDSETSAVVVQLPRTPGRRDAEYMHLLSGPVEAAPPRPDRPQKPETNPNPPSPSYEARLAALEAEVVELRREVDRLQAP